MRTKPRNTLLEVRVSHKMMGVNLSVKVLFSRYIINTLTLGWPKKHKNLKMKNVPLLCGYMDQEDKKKSKRLHGFDNYPASSLPLKIADPPV